MHLTPAIIETAYEYLRSTPPFKGWKLPHADDVEFRITNSQRHMGQATYIHGDRYIIEVSLRYVKTTLTLLETLAHEMVHVRQAMLAPGAESYGHGDDFKKMGASVCRFHGFDKGGF